MYEESSDIETTERDISRNRAYSCIRAATDYDLLHGEDGIPKRNILEDLILAPRQDLGGGYVYSGASWVNLTYGSPVAYLHSCPFDDAGHSDIHEPKDPVTKAISTPLMVDDIKRILQALRDRKTNNVDEEVTKLVCSTNLNFATFLVLRLGFKVDDPDYENLLRASQTASERERIGMIINHIRSQKTEKGDQNNIEASSKLAVTGVIADIKDAIDQFESRVNTGELLITALHKISKSARPEAISNLLNEVGKQGYMLHPKKGIPSSNIDLYISKYPGFTPIGKDSKKPLIGWDKARQKVVFLRPTQKGKNPMALDSVVVTGDGVESSYETFPYCLPIDEMRLDSDDILSAVSDAANALDKMHTAGLVHGDIKPEHIGLGSDGYALLDFEHTAQAGSERKGSSPGYINPIRFAEKDIQVVDDIYAYLVTLLKLYCDFGYRIPTSRYKTERYIPEKKTIIRIPTKKETNIRPEKGSYEALQLENNEMHTWHREIIGRLPEGEMKSFFLKTIVEGDFSQYQNCASLAADFIKKWPRSIS